MDPAQGAAAAQEWEALETLELRNPRRPKKIFFLIGEGSRDLLF